MQTIKVNKLLLNNRCELFFEGGNVFVPLGHCAAKNLPEIIDQLCTSEVTVNFNTVNDADSIASDIKKFSRRLACLDGWNRTEFAPKVVRGFVLATVFECVLTRKEMSCL